ncbi:MAG: hypothetical protein PHX08_15000 [Lachnospiraceae bacterium]|nr:hypothetical protein [Lachnospiraceae bacterium]
MYIIEMEKRNGNEKAKKLRKNGFVPCSVKMGDPEETLLYVITEGAGAKLLREKARGGLVTLKDGENEYPAVIKEISYNGMNKVIEDLAFQVLDDEKVVSTVAKVVLLNKDKVSTMVRILMPEIPYKALPKDLVETVQIDLAQLKPGESRNIEELEMAQNPNIEITVDKSNAVLNIVGSGKNA